MHGFLRVARGLSIAWAVAAVIFMGQAVKPSIDGASMMADWAKAFGWLVGAQLHWTGQETAESMRALLLKSVGQVLFFFGWVVALIATRSRDGRTGSHS